MRLPAINARLIYESLKGNATALSKAGEISKILLFANKNGFDGVVNGAVTLGVSAAILYYVTNEIKAMVDLTKIPKNQSLTEWGGRIFVYYLAQVNVFLPPETAEAVFQKTYKLFD